MVMKMFNKPTLFVNSISIEEVGKENQNYFDSRKCFKGKVFHRVDDIISFMSHNKRVYVLINCLNVNFYGEVVGVNYNYLILRNDNMTQTYSLKNIIEIKILTIV